MSGGALLGIALARVTHFYSHIKAQGVQKKLKKSLKNLLTNQTAYAIIGT
jgi:hypothetical protein